MSVPYQGMLALLRELVGSPDLESLLTAALEGALRLIPGAQAGSALVRQGDHYRFVAMRGHNIPLPRYSLSLEDELRWYAASLEEALMARPNMVRVRPELSGLSSQDRQTLHRIFWSLNVPVPLNGRVEAWICLDRLEAAPFPTEALSLAQELGSSLGVVLQTLKERKNTQARLEREERLARVLGVLSTFSEAGLLWQSLPHLILEILGEERAVALQREGDELKVFAAVNWEGALGLSVPRGKGISWLALEEHRVQMVRMDDPRLHLNVDTNPMEYAAFVPIRDAQGEGFGVVVAYSKQPFEPEDAAVLESFGRGVGQVLARLEAQAAQERELVRLQMLAHISQGLTAARTTEELLQRIVQEAFEQTGASSSLVTLYRPKEDVLEVVAAAGHAAEQALGSRHARGQGLAWKVLEQGSTLYLPDASTAAQAVYTSGNRVKAAYLGVPLGDPEGRIVGVLSVDTAGAGGVLRTQDRYALEALAKVAGVLLSRLQALEQAKCETERYRRLVQMSAELETLDDPHHMARRALQTLLDLTNLSAGGFYQLELEDQNEGTGVMRLVLGHEQQGQGRLQHFKALPVVLGKGFMGLALSLGTAQYIDDYQTWDAAWASLKAHNVRTLLTAPLYLRGLPYGALTLASFDHKAPILEEHISLLEAVARRLERALERIAHLEEITRTREDALRSLGLGLELRDLETKGHTDRVVALSEALGRRLGFPDIEGLRMGAYLHDLGKLAIPDSILLKPGTLTDAEWRIMQSHCDIGFGMLENLSFLSQTARNIVRYHHERIDGSGYPFGLTGEEIPFEARLFAVVDVYDALLQSRPYKAAWNQQDALRELRKQAGDTLDAHIVQEFIALVSEQARARK
ncbi:MAG: GAF domain-containing protein [Meiothermus sp.]|uniref:GAF domain-containing protein n=1 Tax=Meiothermus sp. TaxID=1955249 RepID=UPI0025CC2F49|nr:HD domain-containing phosphohydrolase [Meiothermus sp.]MCS7069720.1 GAF domain-containing protein [Meiothermus sp.]MDW8426767.1 GAF domain-containing protein [Meiothermus sp.]